MSRTHKEAYYMSNVEARLANICKSARLAGFNVSEIGATKAKIWTGQDHSSIWWLSIKSGYIAVYEAGFLKFGDSEKRLLKGGILDSKVFNVSPKVSREDIFDEVMSLINTHFHEITTSEEYPDYLESWRPLAKESLRNELENSRFVNEIETSKRLQAKRKKEITPLV
jgi:hypothetical protein